MFSATLPFTAVHALAFWPVYLWAFHLAELPIRLFMPPVWPPAEPVEQDSLRSIGLVWLLLHPVVTVLAWWAPAQWPAAAQAPLFWAGLVLMVAGSLLRRHCFRMLGLSFTLDVQVRPGQRVVDRGAYRWVRHPGYGASLLVLAGAGLALGSGLSLAVLAGVAAVVYVRRIRVEERALLRVLGAEYARYAARRPRLVPFLC